MNNGNFIKTTLLRWWHYFIYKPDSKEIYWSKIVSSLIVIIGLLAWGYFSHKNYLNLKKERIQFARFSIGITTKTHITRSGHDIVDYEYVIMNSKYLGSDSWIHGTWNLPRNGTRYFIQFASTNPSNAEMLFKYPVPDSITKAPDSGWEYMPGYGDKR